MLDGSTRHPRCCCCLQKNKSSVKKPSLTYHFHHKNKTSQQSTRSQQYPHSKLWTCRKTKQNSQQSIDFVWIFLWFLMKVHFLVEFLQPAPLAPTKPNLPSKRTRLFTSPGGPRKNHWIETLKKNRQKQMEKYPWSYKLTSWGKSLKDLVCFLNVAVMNTVDFNGVISSNHHQNTSTQQTKRLVWP